MMKKTIITIGALIALCTLLRGQQETIMTKYTFNSLFFNPAYAGSHGDGVGTATVQYRKQWMGIHGAPETMLASVEYALKEQGLGLGLTIGRETIGINAQNELAFCTSYRIKTNNGGQISAGLRTALYSINSDFNALNIADQADQTYESSLQSFTSLGVGLGVYYHDDVMYLGLSSPTITSVGMHHQLPTRVNHLFFTAGLLVGDEYSSIKWQPSLLVNYHQAVPLQMTLNLQAWLTEAFAIGVHWRNGDALAVSLELHFDEKWKVSAAYDYTTSDLQQFSNGSPEIMLGYRFFANTTLNQPLPQWYN